MNLLKYSSVALLLITGACQSSNPVAGGGTADVSISFNLPDPNARWEGTGSLGKTLTIDRVTLRVNAPDMDEIVRNLDINNDRTQASAVVEVPKGNDREFTARVKDENNNLQYIGTSTVSIQSNSETVNIVTEGFPPNAVTLSVSAINILGVELNWTRSGANDFESYDIIRATSPDISPGNQTRVFLENITNQNTTTFFDMSGDWNTNYYYAVIVWDLGEMGTRSDPPVGINTGRYSELAYDNGNPTRSFSWQSAGLGTANRLTAPQQAKVVVASYYIVDVSQGGTFQAEVFTLNAQGNPIVRGTRIVTATESGWFFVDFSSDNIMVNGDFYVMMRYNGTDQPSFGAYDEDNGRAWDYNGGWDQWAGTVMMRAFIEFAPGHLLKEPPAAPPVEDYQALSTSNGQLSFSRIIGPTRNTAKVETPVRD